MILGFKPQFVEKILHGTKIHTIREDRGKRWEPGKIIHMATGVRTKQFNMFREEKCTAVQEIKIIPFPPGSSETIAAVFIDEKRMSEYAIKELAMNDGFDSVTDFYAWFNKDFTGRIIHWRDKRY